jgi:membrane fusion protein, heavy metal efflux system
MKLERFNTNGAGLRKPIVVLCVTVVAIVVALGFGGSGRGRKLWQFSFSHMQQAAAAVLDGGQPNAAKQSDENAHRFNTNPGAVNPTLDLSPSQLSSIKIGRVGTYEFPVEEEAVGSISFADEQSVQVFPDYQGTIIKAFAQLDDEVRKDQPLYTITSPDLIQAESTLIGAAATFDLTNKELKRVTGLPGVAQRELEQATSDQQTAEGALKAARDAVRVFGKTDAEIDQMIASRKIDPALVVRSPITGRVTSFNAPPGWLVQPGNPPAPYTVSNLSLKWMLADVMESDIAMFRLGQQVDVKVIAYPNRVFKGRITKIYPSVDPNTHRETIRSEVEDPKDELVSGMLANFVIHIKTPSPGIAIPANGVVREPDGTMTAWVTTDRRHFEQRVLKIGSRRDGHVEILSGLRRGELVVTDGAVFLSNMLEETE